MSLRGTGDLAPGPSQVLWEPIVRAVISRLTGAVSVADVDRWIISLDLTFPAIPTGTEIVLISDFHGYEPANLETHKRLRGVIPTRLAQMGFRTGLVEVGEELVVDPAPRITCSRVAHVHHDAAKMAQYDAQIGNARERFFSDPAAASQWLLFD